MWFNTKKKDRSEDFGFEEEKPVEEPDPQPYWEAFIKYEFERSDGGDRVWAGTVTYYYHWLNRGYSGMSHPRWTLEVGVTDYKQSKDYDEVKEWLDTWGDEFKVWSDFLESRKYYVRYPPLPEETT